MPVFLARLAARPLAGPCAHAGRWRQVRSQRAGDDQGGRRAALGLKGRLAWPMEVCGSAPQRAPLAGRALAAGVLAAGASACMRLGRCRLRGGLLGLNGGLRLGLGLNRRAIRQATGRRAIAPGFKAGG